MHKKKSSRQNRIIPETAEFLKLFEHFQWNTTNSLFIVISINYA
jgi:hypothetical protein